MSKYYPMHFQPVYKDYIWGGDKILSYFNRKEKMGRYAESWEVTDHKDGMSYVTNGPLKGKSLHELVKEMGKDLLGRKFLKFPLLIKLIDAHQNLSVQVHPDDLSAQVLNSEAKTEMWYVIDAEKDAAVLAGFKEVMSQKKFLDALKNKTLVDKIQKHPVKKGDVIYIPGGRVHAVCQGCLLIEIQQNSNTTYRIYDWDRIEDDGKPRPLHLKEAFAVMHWDDTENPCVQPVKLASHNKNELWDLLKSEYFHVQRLYLDKECSFSQEPNTFQVFFALEGTAMIGSEEMRPGMNYLVPASSKEIPLVATKGPCSILRIMLP